MNKYVVSEVKGILRDMEDRIQYARISLASDNIRNLPSDLIEIKNSADYLIDKIDGLFSDYEDYEEDELY